MIFAETPLLEAIFRDIIYGLVVLALAYMQQRNKNAIDAASKKTTQEAEEVKLLAVQKAEEVKAVAATKAEEVKMVAAQTAKEVQDRLDMLTIDQNNKIAAVGNAVTVVQKLANGMRDELVAVTERAAMAEGIAKGRADKASELKSDHAVGGGAVND